MIDAILANFAHYNISELIGLLQTPQFYVTVLMLISLEITLSADNAVVLALLVKHLPHEQQKKALRYGIFGAYAFRVIAIGLGTLLIKFWWIKLIGGSYLLYLAVKYFMSNSEDEDVPVCTKGLIGTIMVIEGMDICFSADSILAAFGVSNSVWVLLIGGMLGILAMRFAAQVFVSLIEKVPELETSAYILITFIGTKMLISVVGYEINEWASFSMMIGSFAWAFITNWYKQNKLSTLGAN